MREAIATIPAGLRRHLDNVEVVIADWPTEEELRATDAPAGHTLFGLYTGIPLLDRTSNYDMVLPDRITIFQGPLEEACDNPEELCREIQDTVIHEFAHHFGLTDEDLRQIEGHY